MALDRTQSGLWREIKAGIDLVEPHVRTLEREQRELCGAAYGDGESGDGQKLPEDPENHGLTHLRMFGAEVATGNYRCALDAQGQEWPAMRTAMLEQAVNKTAEQTRLRHTLRRMLSDYELRYGTLVCTVGPMPGYERDKDAPWTCKADRVPVGDYVWDPTVTDRTLGAWEAHRVVRQIDDVIDEAKAHPELGWNLEALEAIKLHLGKDPKGKNANVDRKDLAYWVMWERGFQIDPAKGPKQGYNGTLHYVADETACVELKGKTPAIRASEPWFGHADGPYAHDGAMLIGDLPVALSPLTSTKCQAEWFNVVQMAGMVAMAQAKTIAGTTDHEAALQIRAAANGDVAVFGGGQTDIRQLVAQIQLGGVNEQWMNASQQALQSLQRNSGTYETRSGNINSDTTATAIMDAQAGFNAVMDFYADGFRGIVEQVFRKWAFWIDVHPKVRVRIGPLPDEIAAQMGEKFLETKGGFSRKQEWDARDHDLLALRVDAFSGRARNEMTMAQDVQVAMGALQFLVSLGPVALSMDVREFLRMVGRSRGITDLDRLIDVQMFREILVTMLQMQQAPAEPQPNSQAKPSFVMGGAGSRVQAGPRPQHAAQPMGPRAMGGASKPQAARAAS